MLTALLLATWSQYEVTAYSKGCTMPKNGIEPEFNITASGAVPIANLTVAADKSFPFGTRLLLSFEGILSPRTVQDRGGAIFGRRLDLYMENCQKARLWGRRKVWVRILENGKAEE